MTNRDYFDRFDQNTHCAYINKIHWIAGSIQGGETAEALEEIQERDWEKILGCDLSTEVIGVDGYEMIDILTNNGKLGFIAEVFFPELIGIKLDENFEIERCTVNQGCVSIYHVYGETPEELMVAIESASKEHVAKMIQENN